MTKVLFVGLTCFDVVSVCEEWPAEDSDTQVYQQAIRRGGNASNSCTCFVSLINWHRRDHPCNCQVEFFGTLAGDVGAEFMEKDMKSCGIITDNVIRYPEATSPLAVIVVNQSNGSRTIFYCHNNVPELLASDFRDKINAENYSWIHLEARKNVPELLQMIRHIRQSTSSTSKRVTVSVEMEKPSNSRDPVFLEEVDYYFVSKDYAKWKGAQSAADSIEAVVKMIPSGKTAVLICGWGETGARAAVVESGSITSQFSSPAFTPAGGPVDTTGAGDSFIAATVFALQVLQHDLNDAIRFGCRFAGAKCGTLGNQGLDDFEQFL